MINVQGLSKTFGELEAVADVGFEVVLVLGARAFSRIQI
jgi:hypothetical protein